MPAAEEQVHYFQRTTIEMIKLISEGKTQELIASGNLLELKKNRL